MQSYRYMFAFVLVICHLAHSAPIYKELDVESDLAKALANDAVEELNRKSLDALYFYQLVDIRSAYQLATYCTCHSVDLVIVVNSNCPKQSVKVCDTKEVNANDKKYSFQAIITGELTDTKRYYQFNITAL